MNELVKVNGSFQNSLLYIILNLIFKVTDILMNSSLDYKQKYTFEVSLFPVEIFKICHTFH